MTLGTRLALLGLLLPVAAPAGLFHLKDSSNGERAPAITLRKRIHVNTLITEPGTMEIEWGGAFSTNGTFIAKWGSFGSPDRRDKRSRAQ